MNTTTRRLCGGVLLTSTAAGCSHPLDGPSFPNSPQQTSSFLGIDLPAPRREVEQPAPPALPDLQAQASLRDCLIYAAWNSPRLEAAFQHWRAALARVPQVSSLPDPNDLTP
ncbi:MAG: hypothetical protein QF471_02990 [Phycisphaerales bacterium]|nr:hypothetical protein [Phycisphaerales bacterium]